MEYDAFRGSVITGETYVVCPKREPHMVQGWDDRMDKMVGVPLLVQKKGKDFVVLTSLNGQAFSFGYKYLEFASVNRVGVRLGDYKFRISEKINTQALRGIVLESDAQKLFNIKGITLRVRLISLTLDQLTQIQQQCPRVLGAMLSNNIMERVN